MKLTLFAQAASGRFVLPSQLVSGCMAGWDDESGCRFTPIKWAPLSSADVGGFVVNSLQGTRLSANQRARMEQQQAVRASFINPALQSLMNQVDSALAERKEQGAKPERQWFPVSNEHGTPYLGDVFVQPGNSALHQ